MAPHAKRKALEEIDTNRARLRGAHASTPTTKRQRALPPALCTPTCYCPRSSRPSSPISSEPPQSAQTFNGSSDYNYDPLWHVLRQQKAQLYLHQQQQAQPEVNMAGSKSMTSSEHLEKGNKRWKESYLHPRFIRILESSDLNGKLSSEHLEDMRHSSPTDKSERDTIGIGTFIEELTEDLLKEMQEWAFTLKKVQANEARWEIDYWQRYFLKTSRQLDSMKTTKAPVIHRIPQASIAIAHDRAKLTPLIADSPEDRRESGLLVDTIVWQPSFSSKSQADRIWYPDHQYAITTKRFASGRRIEGLPFFRLAQTSYLPPHLLVEVKANAKRIDWEQTQNSLAFLTAYLLHERLLLRFLSQNASIEQSQSIDVEDLYVHALSLCGAEAKIWRMHVRSSDNFTDLPIRYDMHLIAKLDSVDDDHAQQLRSWINAINAHAQAVTFPSLQQDFKSYDNLHKTKETTRLQDIGFVYVESGDGEKRIAAKRLKELREAFRKGVIRPDERIGDSVIFEIDEDGNAMEMPIGVDHTFLTPPESKGSVAVGSGEGERAPALVLDVHQERSASCALLSLPRYNASCSSLDF
jgi:hypothetical protein